MKSSIRILWVVFGMALVLLLTPFQSQAVTYETMRYDGSLYYFNVGHNYKITITKGAEECFFMEDDDDDLVTSVSSSDTSVLAVTNTGEFDCEVAGKKAGTSVVTIKTYNEEAEAYKTTKIKVTVKSPKAKEKKSKIEITHWVYKSTTKVTVKATNVKKGDIIKLKIGKKTYKKKIKKTASKVKVKIKIKKPGFYGKKYKLTLNRKGKVKATEKQYVFLSRFVHVGDSKKKVKWLAYWNDPDKKNKSAYSEQWCYDWDEDGYHDAYLYFNNKGKVTNWQIYE